METFTLSRKELHRPGLLKALCGGRLTNAQVAAALRITVRQVRRLKRRFEAGGPGALVHGNRDRPSPRRLPAAVRDAVIRLMTTVYVSFNDTHLTEKLREHHALGPAVTTSSGSASPSMRWADVYVPQVSPASMSPRPQPRRCVDVPAPSAPARDAMGRRLRLHAGRRCCPPESLPSGAG